MPSSGAKLINSDQSSADFNNLDSKEPVSEVLVS